MQRHSDFLLDYMLSSVFVDKLYMNVTSFEMNIYVSLGIKRKYFFYKILSASTDYN